MARKNKKTAIIIIAIVLIVALLLYLNYGARLSESRAGITARFYDENMVEITTSRGGAGQLLSSVPLSITTRSAANKLLVTTAPKYPIINKLNDIVVIRSEEPSAALRAENQLIEQAGR